MDEFPSKNKAYWKRQQRQAHKYVSVLRIIHTWASCDKKRIYEVHGCEPALDPDHVIRLCESVLSTDDTVSDGH